MWYSYKLKKQLSALKILFPGLWMSQARPPLTVGLLLICYKGIFLKIADFTIKLKFTALNVQLVPSEEFDLTQLLEKAPPSGHTKVQTLLNDLNGWKSAKKLTLEVDLLHRLCEAQSSTWRYFRRWEEPPTCWCSRYHNCLPARGTWIWFQAWAYTGVTCSPPLIFPCLPPTVHKHPQQLHHRL